MRRAIAALVVAALSFGAAGIAAQEVDPSALPEYRLDVTLFTGAQLGVGASMPVSRYSRLGALVAAGGTADGPATRGTARFEVHGRFSADPFQALRWAPYVVAGGMLACADARRCRPLILLRIGVEGSSRSGYIPGVELGLGDGVQLGVVFRRSRPGRR